MSRLGREPICGNGRLWRKAAVHGHVSCHQLKFKGPGFDFDAKGWLAILAAIAIVALILTLPQLLHWLF